MGREKPQTGGSGKPHTGAFVAVAAVIVVSLLLGAGVLARPDRVASLFGAPTVGWRRGVPAAAPGPVLPVVAGDAPVPTADALTRTLAEPLSDPALGHASVAVTDVGTGQRLYDKAADTPSLPASTTKLLTATAVLAARGPAYRLTTRAVAGANPGEVVLVGAGDPTLAAGADATYAGAARLDDLAAQVKQALGGVAPTRVVVDGSLFPGPTAGPGWDDDATAGYGAPITALMIDGARSSPVPPHGFAPRSTQPDLAAGQALAAALGLSGGAVGRGSAPADAKPLGSVASPPMVRLVEEMLVESDNVIAECLARQVALARSQPASFAGAAAAVTAALADLGLAIAPGVLVDGSGLSRNDRLSPALLTGLLALDAKGERPELRAVFNGLPVAGYSGTLRDRYRKVNTGGKAAGVVRAKTGTLTPGVSAIAGVVVDADGRTLAFAVLATVGDNAFPAQDALDRFAATLAACGCR